MPNNQLKIMGDEFLTSIDHYGEFIGNLLFDYFIYRPMCTHMVNTNLTSTATLPFGRTTA